MQGSHEGFQQDLHKSFSYGPCTRDDFTRISTRPLRGFHLDLHNIFSQRPLQDHTRPYKTLVKIFIHERRPWTLCKVVVIGSSKELLRPPCKGSQSICKIRTAPQQERSDTHKVLRGLRKRYQNSHRAAMEAIRHAQKSREGARFSQNIASPTKKRTLKISKHSGLSNFFVEVCKVLCLPGKPEARNLKINDDNFTKSSKFTKYSACQRFSNVQECHACHADEKSARCPAPVTQNNVFRPQNVPDVSRAAQNGHSSKNEHGATGKTRPSEQTKSVTHILCKPA